MAGSASFDPYEVPLAQDAVPIVVALYYEGLGEPFVGLPNVRCLGIQHFEGASPSAARFAYIFDDHDPDTPYPKDFDECWPLDKSNAQNQYVVQQDERIVVFGYTPTGTRRVLFDGFASIPQADLSPDHQAVTFSASGVAIRLWDEPVAGAWMRDSDALDSTDPDDVVGTDLPARFNPHVDGISKPNKTKSDVDVQDQISDDETIEYPVFVDWRLTRGIGDEDPRELWTLDGAIRYLLGLENDEEFIDNPDLANLKDLLKDYKPRSGGGDGFYDPEDAASYEVKDIIIRDYDATGKPLPEALNDLLGYHGFGMKFVVEEDNEGRPYNTLDIYRKDGNGNAPKRLALQAKGEGLDPGQSNVSGLQLSRDHHSAANEYIIETEPVEYEVSIVLAPLFEIVAADANNTKQFGDTEVADQNAAMRKNYHWFGADEDGEGHWDLAGGSYLTDQPLNLDDVLGEPEEGVPVYATRLRPGRSTLISKDEKGKPRKVVLAISTDYDGEAPAVWDGSGGWRSAGTNWTLLKDRIGVDLKLKDGDGWIIGKSTQAFGVFGEKIAVVTSLAAPTTASPKFYLRLTTVIDGDKMLDAKAEKRSASPSQYSRIRRVDCKDHFKKQVVHSSSVFGDDSGEAVRDDTEKAIAYAEALRAAHEFPPLAGSVTIPWITNSFHIGDRIESIDGRNVSFRVNSGSEAGEAARYPVIVAIGWEFEGGGQRTTLQLADRRSEPERFGRW